MIVSTICAFLLLALQFLLLIGLINPCLILRWSKKPTRLKVIGFYFLISFILLLTMVLAVPVDENISNTDKTEQSGEIDNFNNEIVISGDTIIDLGELELDENGCIKGPVTEISSMRDILNKTNVDNIVIQLTTVSKVYGKTNKIYQYSSSDKIFRDITMNTFVVWELDNLSRDEFKEELNNSNICTFMFGIGERYLELNRNAGEDIFVSLAGAKPYQSSSGTVKCVKEYIKENSYNSDKVKFINWFNPVPDTKNLCWSVKCVYKAPNALGTIIQTTAYFKVRDDKVIGVEIE